MRNRKPAQLMALFACCLLAHVAVHAQVVKASSLKGSYRSMYEMLKDVPGVEVKMGAAVNKGTVTIRGTGSLRAQGAPLLLVNENIYEGDLSDISPQDVESITVMKDGSATSYGSRAMFGVIQIHLKKGAGDAVAVHTYEGSAYKYFIDKQFKLKVFGKDEKVIIEGVIKREKGDSLVFIRKRKEVLVAISDVKRVEVIPEED